MANPTRIYALSRTLVLGGLSAAFAAAEPNILLVTVDTLRADHLSCYGYGWKTSPNIDKLAAEGTKFSNAYTPIPLTGPAHLSLFTSRYPQEHGAVRNGIAMATEQPLVTLPQYLRANGYNTAGFISGWPLTGRLTGINEWFDHYDETLTRKFQLFNSARWAEDVTPPAITWLKQNAGGNKPFFAWVHYFDPHSPYDFREHFADLPKSGSSMPPESTDAETRERIRAYDTEIAYMDWHLGKLLNVLEELKVADSTLVVLTADHGESLGEHDYVGHGRHLYQNIIRVPLIIRWPGKVKAGQTVPASVSLLDIAPTISDLTAQSKPAQGKVALTFGGRSLAPALMEGSRLTNRPIYNLTFPGKKGFAPGWLSWLWISGDAPLRFGRIDGTTKFIWSPADSSLAAYDLARDSRENNPTILREGVDRYANETARVKTWFARTESRSREQVISKRDLEVLKSLGYVQ
jgi:arylsulfatase A-like enzyme